MSTHIKQEEIIDVDALPEWNRCNVPTANSFRRHEQPAHSNKTAATIDLTMDDSDSDISILSSTTKPSGSGTPGPSNGKGREIAAIKRIRVRTV